MRLHIALLALLGLAFEARAQELTPDKSVTAPAPPAPASRSGALWAALSSFQKAALEDVLAASGYAFRATACANDCPCIEWREEALAVGPAATVFGIADTELDLAKTPVDAGFTAIKASIDAGRALVETGPGEVGVVYGYKLEPKTFFVHALVGDEKRSEGRPVDALSELWELHSLSPGRTPPYEAAAFERAVLLQAIAHAHRPPERGGCGFLDAPALNGWGLSAFHVFAQKLATGDRGIAGAYGAVIERAAHLRAGRAAAVAFLEKAAKRRDAEKAGSGSELLAAAKLYKDELEQALVPLETRVTGKGDTVLAGDALRKQAAQYLEKAAALEKSALVILEKSVFEGRVSDAVRDALTLARTAPVLEKTAPELITLLEKGEADMRLLAVSALADTPGPAARAALGRALLDGDGPVAEAALVALEVRNEEALVDLLLDAWARAPRTHSRSERPLQRQLVFALADHASDPKALKALEKALEDQGEGDEIPDAIPRWAAACLYAIQGVDAEPTMLAAMSSSRPAARRAAVSVLDLSGSKQAIAALEGALTDQDQKVRFDSSAALGRRGDDKGLKVALGALKDPSREVRTLGVEALTRIGGPAVPALVKLLDDKDWRVRANACVVLGRTGKTNELKKVAALEKDPEPAVRELALQAKAIVEGRARAEGPKK
jgi:HEAT repeat protein